MIRLACFRQGEHLSKNLREALLFLPWDTHYIDDVAELKICLPLMLSAVRGTAGAFLPDKRDQPVTDFSHVGVIALQFPLQESLLEYAPHCQHRDRNDCQQCCDI